MVVIEAAVEKVVVHDTCADNFNGTYAGNNRGGSNDGCDDGRGSWEVVMMMTLVPLVITM